MEIKLVRETFAKVTLLKGLPIRKKPSMVRSVAFILSKDDYHEMREGFDVCLVRRSDRLLMGWLWGGALWWHSQTLMASRQVG